MFEFDLNKSAVNKDKHGIDFELAQKLWDDVRRVVIPARFQDEMRYLLIAKLEGDTWTAVYTIRKENVRIISVRKSREYEKEIYLSSRV